MTLIVPNLRHETVRLDDASRRFLRLLDGSRDRAALAAELRGAVTLDAALGALTRAAFLTA